MVKEKSIGTTINAIINNSIEGSTSFIIKLQ
jgi:hypothetical protein